MITCLFTREFYSIVELNVVTCSLHFEYTDTTCNYVRINKGFLVGV